MTDDAKLLPCPFCGSTPTISGISDTAIRCPNDQCIIYALPIPFNDFGHRAAAIAAWNRRAPSGAESAEAEFCAEELGGGEWAVFRRRQDGQLLEQMVCGDQGEKWARIIADALNKCYVSSGHVAPSERGNNAR